MGSLRKSGAALSGLALILSITAATRPEIAAQVRVDQGGYAPGETKTAYLMTGAARNGERFAVLDSRNRTVLSGKVGKISRGAWNDTYQAVYPIDLSPLEKTGTYSIKVGGAESPAFTIRSEQDLYGQLVRDGVTFYQTQRDGKDVIKGDLNRKPSHLNDAYAGVYQTPTFVTDDIIAESDLTRLGGTAVNVEGGWFDAGDYLKFTHSTAYGAIDLLAAQRAMGGKAPAALGAESRHGIDWLDKMWDQKSKTLYLQVGIGSGNDAGTFLGDHDIWRLPEQDDTDSDPDARYATSHRPVFEAAAPGAPISPNLAGRVAAAFAMAAQQDPPARAAADLKAATSLYARAAVKNPPKQLTTALPFDFYPEDTWHDDMELAAAEIALAGRRLHLPGTDKFISQAAGFAAGYIAGETGDTFNLYDVSALAHTDLIVAMGHSPGRALAVSRAQLAADLKRQVKTGATRSATDPFRAGGVYTDFDVDSHTFGLIATEAMYRSVTGDRSFDAYATAQRNWLLGANAWGTSFMVGEGSTFPHCTQHQVANLNGSVDGSRPVLTGAVVNGPNDPSLFEDGLGDYQDGMVACPPAGNDPFAAFNRADSRFVDDVRAWQTDEPALDMTGAAIIGAALQSASH
ncbi:glycoside hydrolase family 9 protein [Actinoplanes sp. NPDC051343]|uniref:glycoside hydrolase family 9 protein n=1 Tax=Actinoplanes sp. NPDC051343 TaxID=3363906 RepID=UPI0037B41A80